MDTLKCIQEKYTSERSINNTAHKQRKHIKIKEDMKNINKVPTHLKHTPIIGVDNYSFYDGQYKNATDAKALSVGIAQWNENDDKYKDISARVFRYVKKNEQDKGNWSRQSEEIPLHRCFDLCCLIIQAISKSQGREFDMTQELKPYVVNEEKFDDIKTYYENNKEDLLCKMSNLHSLLSDFLSKEIK